MKTYAGWHGSGLDLSQYLSVGDLVDEELYYYVLEVLPPATMTSKVLQMGEPYSHDANGKPTFSTLIKRADGWHYEGHMTIDDALES